VMDFVNSLLGGQSDRSTLNALDNFHPSSLQQETEIDRNHRSASISFPSLDSATVDTPQSVVCTTTFHTTFTILRSSRFGPPTSLHIEYAAHPSLHATLPVLTCHFVPATPRALIQSQAVKTLMEFMDGHFHPLRARYSCENPFPAQPVNPPHCRADIATSSTREVHSISRRV
jgi:hypothetical protein